MKNEDLPPPLRDVAPPQPPVWEELPLEEVPDVPPQDVTSEPPLQAPSDPFLRRG